MQENKKRPLKEYWATRVAPFFKKNGAIVSVSVCALLVAGTWLVSSRLPQVPTVPGGSAAPSPQQSAVQSNLGLDEHLSNVLPPWSSATQAPTDSGGNATAPTTAVLRMTKPVSGTVSAGYAMEKLVYSKTLNQWQTHSGVDIAAEKGQAVTAALGGTVEKVYTDDLMGKCMVINSANSVQCLYASMEETLVKEGDKITEGQTIGKVGATAMEEAAEGSHLHFEVWVNGETKDPAGYFEEK